MRQKNKFTELFYILIEFFPPILHGLFSHSNYSK